jgi:hypothetical protein
MRPWRQPAAEGPPVGMAPKRQKNPHGGLGGSIQYFIADEALSWGHVNRGRGGCLTPIDKLARDVASSAKTVKSVFPNVMFAAVESYGVTIADLEEYLVTFQHAYGEPFAFVKLDIGWQTRWQRHTRDLVAHLRVTGRKIAIIYNGNKNDPSDKAWLDNTLRHAWEYELVVGSAPDIAVFQSWVPKPRHVLSETSQNSFTSVVLKYIKSH